MKQTISTSSLFFSFFILGTVNGEIQKTNNNNNNNLFLTNGNSSIIASASFIAEEETHKCGEGYCMHGSTCVSYLTDGDGAEEDEDGYYYCDCETANTNDKSFAGKYCQYEATSYCTRNPGINHHLFCVNDGSCKKDMYDNSNGSIGCNCKDGFMGFNCEKTAEEVDASTDIVLFDTVTPTNEVEKHEIFSPTTIFNTPPSNSKLDNNSDYDVKYDRNDTLLVPSAIEEKYDVASSKSFVSSSSDFSSPRPLLKAAGVLVFILLVFFAIAGVNQRQFQRSQHMKSTSATTLMHDGSNSIYFTDMSSRTVDTNTSLSSKQDYNFDPIPSQLSAMPSTTNINQHSPIDIIIDNVDRSVGMGMASSDSTPVANLYSTERKRGRGGLNNFHQLQPVEII